MQSGLQVLQAGQLLQVALNQTVAQMRRVADMRQLRKCGLLTPNRYNAIGTVVNDCGQRMAGFFHHTAHDMLTELSDWVVVDNGVISKPGKYIRIGGDSGPTDGAKTASTYHFDPTKWYRITVTMDIDPLKAGVDHDGGQFSVEAKGGSLDHVPLTLGWGIAGEITPPSPATQSLLIHPDEAAADAHFRVISMGIPSDPIEIAMIKIEEFDSDPTP